jgi:hypothetical protein
MPSSIESNKQLSQGVKAVETGEERDLSNNESSSVQSIDLRKELINTYTIDPVLTKKIALVNAAIDEIGMTPFQWKLFFLNGFGYAVDSVSFQPSWNHAKPPKSHREYFSFWSSVSPSLSQQSLRNLETPIRKLRAFHWRLRSVCWSERPSGASRRMSSVANWRSTRVCLSVLHLF